MKLRQKLAAVLVASLIGVAVPTMASSENKLSRSVVTVEKDSILGFNEKSELKVTTPAGLNLTFEDSEAGVEEVFYIELEGASWEKKIGEQSIESVIKQFARFNHEALQTELTVTRESSSVLKVKYIVQDTENRLFLPLFAKIEEAQAKVAITTQGGQSSVSESEFVFAKTQENQLKATVIEPKHLYYEGALGEVDFTEAYAGSMADESASFVYEIKNDEYEFSIRLLERYLGKQFMSQDEKGIYTCLLNPIFIEYLDGFGDYNFMTKPVKMIIDPANAGVATFIVPKMSSDSIGRLKLKYLPVEANTKTPAAGNLEVAIKDVKGQETLTEEIKGAVLGLILPHKTYMLVHDTKEMTAGKVEEITFRIGEMIEDSMIGGREVEISLEGGAYFACDENGQPTLMEIDDQETALFSKATTLRPDGVEGFEYEYVDEDDYSKGISKIIVTLNEGLGTNLVGDYFDLKTELVLPVSAKDNQVIYLKAEGRGLENEVAYPIQIKNSFEVSVEPMVAKVGLQDQVGGKITLTEAEAGLLQRGELVFEIVKGDETPVKGITFYNEAKDGLKLEVSSSRIELDEEGITKEGKITIKYPQASSELPNSLSLSQLKLTTDRTVAEGSYDLKISGSAIDETGNEDENYILIKDFLVIGTPNTEALEESQGLAKGSSSFKIGETSYTVNGVEKQMDGAAYSQGAGYTMVPIRYVAEAFGIGAQDLLFSNGSATLFAGGRTLQLTNGSDEALVNGIKIKMAAKVEIKEGRTYAPIGEVAQLLGLQKAWNPETKTATFTNESF